jgi:hypothetical protein
MHALGLESQVCQCITRYPTSISRQHRNPTLDQTQKPPRRRGPLRQNVEGRAATFNSYLYSFVGAFVGLGVGEGLGVGVGGGSMIGNRSGSPSNSMTLYAAQQ